MTGKLKALGLALLAVFAMSAVAASAAQATEGTFSWATGTTKLTGETDPTAPSNVFTIKTKTGGTATITCNEVHAEVGVTGTGSPSVLSGPVEYSDTGLTETKGAGWCTAKIGETEAAAQVRMNGCEYRFRAGTTVGSLENMETEGTVDIVCPGTSVIEVEVEGACLVKVGPQEGLGPVYYRTATTPTQKEREEGKREDVTIEAKVGDVPGSEHNKTITYSTSKVLCGTQTNVTGGTYTGNVTVTGLDKNGNKTDVTVT